jgi:hypothetical protein
MKIEVLYIQDCPGYRPTLAAIEKILAEEKIAAAVTPIEVTSANAPGFPGSPTVWINGKDIERDASPAGACGLACRTYVAVGPLSVCWRQWLAQPCSQGRMGLFVEDAE